MSKEIIEFTLDETNLIVQQYFPQNTTQQEVDFCLSVAKELGLNPITKEIWFIERQSNVNGKWVKKIEPMVGRDSFLKIAHRSGEFGGIETSATVEVVPKLVNGEWEDKKDLIATCKVYRNGIEKPFMAKVNYNEYVQKKNEGTPTKFWNEKPHTMLKKVAESQALRKALSITGVYDENEIRNDYNPNDMPTIEPTDVEVVEHKPSIDLLKIKLKNCLIPIGINEGEVREFAKMFNLSDDIVAIQALLDDKALLMEKVEEFENSLNKGS